VVKNIAIEKIKRNNPNTYGRALEYIVIMYLWKRNPIKAKEITVQPGSTDVFKGKGNFESLDTEIKLLLKEAAYLFWQQLPKFEDLSYYKNNACVIQTFPDRAGMQLIGHTADFSLKTNGVKPLLVSLKHNNDALKHNRISKLLTLLGLEKEQMTFNKFCSKLIKKTESDLFAKGYKEWPEVPIEVKMRLYNGILKKFVSVVNSLQFSSRTVLNFFIYLCGGKDLPLRAIYSKGSWLFKHISTNKVPHSFSLSSNKNYLIFAFDNGFVASMRIKNDHSGFGKPITKLDVRQVLT